MSLERGGLDVGRPARARTTAQGKSSLFIPSASPASQHHPRRFSGLRFAYIKLPITVEEHDYLQIGARIAFLDVSRAAASARCEIMLRDGRLCNLSPNEDFRIFYSRVFRIVRILNLRTFKRSCETVLKLSTSDHNFALIAFALIDYF